MADSFEQIFEQFSAFEAAAASPILAALDTVENKAKGTERALSKMASTDDKLKRLADTTKTVDVQLDMARDTAKDTTTEIREGFEQTNQRLRQVDRRLEQVERSFKQVNTGARGIRDYNNDIQRAARSTRNFDREVENVNEALDAQVRKTKQLTDAQEALNRARRRGRPPPGTETGTFGGGAGVGGLGFLAGFGAVGAAGNAVGNAFTLNRILNTIRAEGASEAQIAVARETIGSVSGATRFTAEDVGTFILNSMRAGGEIGDVTRALPMISQLAIAEDMNLEDTGRMIAAAAQSLERPLSQMGNYAEQVTMATSMSPLRPQDIEFIQQRALGAFRIAGGDTADMLAITAELRKTVSSRELLGTAMKNVPLQLTNLAQGRGTKRQLTAKENLRVAGIEMEGRPVTEVFTDILQHAVDTGDRGVIFDIFGMEAGQSIQQLATQEKINNIIQNRQRLIEANGELQRKANIQTDTATNSWEKLLSAITMAGVELVNAIGGGHELETFKDLLDLTTDQVTRFTNYIKANREIISQPFERFTVWLRENKDAVGTFFRTALEVIDPVVKLFVLLTTTVARYMVEHPRLTGVILASLFVWKVFGGLVMMTIFRIGALATALKGIPPLLAALQTGQIPAALPGILAWLTKFQWVRNLLLAIPGAIAPIGAAFAKVTGIVGAFITATAALSGWIIALIAAAVAGLVVLVVRNWEAIKGMFGAVGDFFKAVVMYFYELGKTFVVGLQLVFHPLFEEIGAAVDWIWEKLKVVGSWIESVFLKPITAVTNWLQKTTGKITGATVELREQRAPIDAHRERQRTYKEAVKTFRQEDVIRRTLETQRIVEASGNAEAQAMLKTWKEERSALLKGEQTEIDTRKELEAFVKRLETIQEMAKTPPEAEAPAAAGTTPTAATLPTGALPTAPTTAGNVARVGPSRVEYVDFTSVKDLQVTLESGFQSLTNINSSILDTLRGNSEVIDRANPAFETPFVEHALPNEVNIPAIAPSPQVIVADTPVPQETQATQDTQVVQNISVTINAADGQDPQEIARAVVAELGRGARTNQFGGGS